MMVYVTSKNLAEARLIAMHLLESKLIACANFFPAKSMYWWEGKIVEESEQVVIMKTSKKHFKNIKREVLKMHSSDVPCIVGYAMHAGHEDFLKWLKKTVG